MVEQAASGEEGLAIAKKRPPTLVVLDLMLPGMDGLAVCRKLRAGEATKGVFVLMLTARGEEEDVVQGLDAGADDYVVKPFSTVVLAARVRSALRRAGKAADDGGEGMERDLVFDSLAVSPSRHEVRVDGELADLTATEFRLLMALVRRPGRVFTRNQLLDAVHGREHAVTDRAVDVQVVGLRKKLGAAGARVETIRGVGYRFSDE